jgi:hypothetical protein
LLGYGFRHQKKERRLNRGAAAVDKVSAASRQNSPALGSLSVVQGRAARGAWPSCCTLCRMNGPFCDIHLYDVLLQCFLSVPQL